MQKEVKFILKAGVSIGLLSWILYGLDFELVYSHLARFSWWQFMASLVIVLFVTWAQGVRWYYIVTILGDEIIKQQAIKIVFFSMFFNQTLPSTVGGDVVRVGYAKNKGLSWGKALIGVVLDRIIGLVAMLILSVIGLIGLWYVSGMNDFFLISVFVVLFGAAATVLILMFDLLPENVRMIPLISSFVSLSRWARVLVKGKGRFYRTFFISLAVQFAFVFVAAFIGYALGLELGVIEIIAVYPIALLLANAPISIAGWGVREGVMVAAMSLVGVAGEIAVTISVLYGFVLLMVGVIGGIMWGVDSLGADS